jgi:tetratricopeptide (TPR) repeat protein
MSLRFRRSITIIPGVRLNFSKSTMGLSVGVPGARVSVNTRGDVYTSAGIPGTGLYNVERSSLRGARSKGGSRAEAAELEEFYIPTRPPKPGLFAMKRERTFYDFLREHFEGENALPSKATVDRALELAEKYPRIKYSYLVLACLVGARDDKYFPDVLKVSSEVWQNRERAFRTFEARKYFPQMNIELPVTHGISFVDSFGLSAFGFLYVEVLQEANKNDEALKVLESMPTTQLSAVSAVDIELTAQKFQDVLDSTEDLELEDEATGMLFIMRAAALSQLGFHDGALEAIKRVVAKRSLDEEVRNRALWERANIFERQGKRSHALKELEKIVLADSKYPEVMTRITNLRAATESGE